MLEHHLGMYVAISHNIYVNTLDLRRDKRVRRAYIEVIEPVGTSIEHASDRVNFTLHLSNALTECSDKMLKRYFSCAIHTSTCTVTDLHLSD